MVKIQVEWTLKGNKDQESIEKLVKETDYSKTFLTICCQRGLNTKEKIENFIHASQQRLHDPFLMNDMEKAVSRIEKAIKKGEKIFVYGDYDADGITSTALLVDALRTLGGQVAYYIPHRMRDGYGPNLKKYQEIIEEDQPELLITVDNGIAGHDALALAKKRQLDVIVTDHHEIPQTLPEAYALVHPALKMAAYPFPSLAGVGVAYKVVAALDSELASNYLDLVAIGTVADLVPLLDENRALVQLGLQSLRQGTRLGLHALMSTSGVRLQEVDETSIGFQLAPRLNALGRIGDANKAVELLLTDDLACAGDIAQRIEESNHLRKKLVAEITESAQSMIDDLDLERDYIIVLGHQDWHPGVVGIVASRIVEIYQRPTILLAIDREEKYAKGSGRSVQGFNLYEACLAVKELTTQFGGHEMAAGLTLPAEKIDAYRRAINDQIDLTQVSPPLLEADLALEPRDITIELIEELDLLRPFGTANEVPQFMINDVVAKEVKSVGAQHAHLKLLLVAQEKQTDVIAFNQGHLEKALPEHGDLSIYGHLELNEWNGYRKPQIVASAIKLPRPWLIDWRSSELQTTLFTHLDKIYLVYQDKLAQMIRYHYPKCEVLTYSQIQSDTHFDRKKPVIIVDFPPSKKALKHTLSLLSDQWIYMYLYKADHWVIEGLPTRNDCAQVYQLIRRLDGEMLETLAKKAEKRLKIPKHKVHWIIKMFLEAKFVKIEKGKVILNKDPSKVNLKEMPAYLYLQEQKDLEEILLYSSFQVMKKSLVNLIQTDYA